MRRRSLAIAFLCVTNLAAVDLQGATLSTWIQLGPGTELSARVITEGEDCPVLRADGKPLVMQTRSAPEAPFGKVKDARFPVRSCEAAVPPGTRSLLLDDKPLPLLPANVRRVLMLGDTGCRLSKSQIQDCNDPQAWPYARIAARAALTRPDLVIHLGDYHYREEPCPGERVGCQGSPYGYGWDVWNADFFAPSGPLLAAAPWLMVRGNHEDCERAAEGWFRFLDSGPMPHECRDLTGFFVSRAGDLGLVVMDGAKTSGSQGALAGLIDLLRHQFAQIQDQIPAEAWLLTHRPVNAVLDSPVNAGRDNLQQPAIGEDLPPSIRMIVSGHYHFFQALEFAGLRPPQLVVGTGGDMLTPIPLEPILGAHVNGAKVTAASVWSGFGFMLWDRNGAAWDGTLFDVQGTPVRRCQLAGHELHCAAESANR